MILIFDLDDTLYDEMTYVMSGLKAVARFGETTFGWDAAQSLAFMQAHLIKHGRGKIFDEWLRYHGRFSSARVATCIRVYRHHQPEIELFPTALKLIQFYQKKSPLYLVTDGHKVAQKQKVSALKLEAMFKRIFITHRFGIQNAKPSLHCFDIIRKTECRDWSSIVYVGDNPTKDFVNLNQMGALTIRVSTGSHATAIAQPGYDARVTIPDLTHLPATLNMWKERV